jgi:lipoprotein-releasing system permease protein
MCYKFSSKVAFRYFFAKKNERFVSFISKFSLIGVMIGVAALIVVMSVMNGFRAELAQNIIGLNSDITILASSKSLIDPDLIMTKLSKENFVESATPVVMGQGLAVGPRTSSGVIIKGISLADLSQKHQITNHIVAGDLLQFNDINNVAIGAELANNLDIRLGDKLKIISSQVISTAFGSMPRSKDFTVTAIFQSGLYTFDSATILMPVETAIALLSLDNVNMIEVHSKNPDEASQYAHKLYQNLDQRGLIISSWQEQNAQFFNALKVERIAMFTILSLIIVVAAFNIISSLFMLVKDKTHDIAILRTMGASKRDIMMIFMINGMMIGSMGTFLGVVLGYGFASNIDNIKKWLEKMTNVQLFDYALYFLHYLPSKIEMSNVIVVTALSLALCFLATIYPAYRAASTDPVEAMRYE